MNTKEALAWFDKIAAFPSPRDPRGDVSACTAWLAEAESALAAVLPVGHPILRRWDALMPRDDASRSSYVSSFNYRWMEWRGLFDAGRKLLLEGRLESLVAGVQAATIEELLEQADDLLARKYIVAASVVAGGALETHLRHLCDRHGIAISGDGSLSKYNDALAQARNAGTEITSKTQTALVKGWGGIRNDAAHDPSAFAHDAGAVRSMIDGIRSFMASVP